MVMNDTMKTKLINATISSIEAAGGIRGVSLRGIAKAAGCSHVNVYHYAPRGLPDLLWPAYAEALDAFSDALSARAGARKPGESFGEATARAGAAFALARPGLYRLLWFEDIDGAASGGVPDRDALAAIARAKGRFQSAAREAFAADGFRGSEEEFGRRLELFFAFLQGELALLLNGRSGARGPEAVEGIGGRAALLWGLLVDRG